VRELEYGGNYGEGLAVAELAIPGGLRIGLDGADRTLFPVFLIY
jgi:hypothetical protein